MVSFDFLGGGVLTFVVILIAVFLIWILYRMIIAPLFGFGKKTIGRFSERAMANSVDAWTKIRGESERERRELAEEGEAGLLEREGKDLTANALGLLNNTQSTKDFSEEKINKFKIILNEQEKTVNRLRELFDKLSKEYHSNRKTFRTVFNKLQNFITQQSKVERGAIEQARKIEKFNQKDRNLERIITIVEEIKPLANQLIAIDAQDRRNFANLDAFTKNRSIISGDLTRLLYDSRSVFHLSNAQKVAPLQQVPYLQQNQKLIDQKISELKGFTEEAEKIHITIGQLMAQMEQIGAKIVSLLHEQQEKINESEAYLQMLKAQGAIPKGA